MIWKSRRNRNPCTTDEICIFPNGAERRIHEAMCVCACAAAKLVEYEDETCPSSLCPKLYSRRRDFPANGKRTLSGGLFAGRMKRGTFIYSKNFDRGPPSVIERLTYRQLFPFRSMITRRFLFLSFPFNSVIYRHVRH